MSVEHRAPLVAIVILNYNGKHYFQKFLPSVVASSYPNKKIFVADNASTDDSMKWITENYPEVGLILNGGNFGYAKGYNEALKGVEADYYVLLNSDVEVTTGWIEPIIALMESDEMIAACQPKLLAFNDKHLFEYAGASGGWLDQFGYPFSRGRVFDVCEIDGGQYDDIAQVFWATGAAMFVRTEVFHEMQGFDEFFFAHQEEIDLCWRMQLAGFKIFACPGSVVYHVGGGTLPKGGRKVYLNFRNNLVMLTKNLNMGEKLWKIPFRIMLDLVSAFKALFFSDPAFTKGVLQAHFSYVAWLLSSKKNNRMPAKRTGKLTGYYKGIVVWDYFVRKKKTFKEIIG